MYGHESEPWVWEVSDSQSSHPEEDPGRLCVSHFGSSAGVYQNCLVETFCNDSLQRWKWKELCRTDVLSVGGVLCFFRLIGFLTPCRMRGSDMVVLQYVSKSVVTVDWAWKGQFWTSFSGLNFACRLSEKKLVTPKMFSNYQLSALSLPHPNSVLHLISHYSLLYNINNKDLVVVKLVFLLDGAVWRGLIKDFTRFLFSHFHESETFLYLFSLRTSWRVWMCEQVIKEVLYGAVGSEYSGMYLDGCCRCGFRSALVVFIGFGCFF